MSIMIDGSYILLDSVYVTHKCFVLLPFFHCLPYILIISFFSQIVAFAHRMDGGDNAIHVWSKKDLFNLARVFLFYKYNMIVYSCR